MKKCLKIVSILIISFVFSTYVFAAQANKDDVTLSVASREECVIKFGQYGEFEKKLVKIDEENKTIDVSLTVRNTYDGSTTREEEEVDSVPGEVVFLIDSSNSMTTPEISGVTRHTLILNAAQELVEKLFALNSDIEIGITEFSSATQISEIGSSSDATKLLDLSNNKSEVKNTIANVSSAGGFTDLDAGLKNAKTIFSNDTQKSKYLIILTDGVPNLSITTGNDVQYSPEVTNATIAELTSIQNSGINIMSILADSDFYTEDGELFVMQPGHNASLYTEPVTHMDIAEEIFGTETSPKFGKVFYVEGNNVTTAITEDIYQSLRSTRTITIDEKNKYSLTDVVIKDYFPQNIVDNFNFSKLSEPQIGTVSDSIDTTDNSITWNIPKLEPKQSSTFTYRLSLKDTFNGEIIDLTLPTNEKVTITHKINDEPGDPAESNKTPAVILKKKEVPDTPTPTPDDPGKKEDPEDPTVAPTPIPQTGSIIGAFVVLGVASSTFLAIKLHKLSK